MVEEPNAKICLAGSLEEGNDFPPNKAGGRLRILAQPQRFQVVWDWSRGCETSRSDDIPLQKETLSLMDI